jgi:hypothetical protein
VPAGQPEGWDSYWDRPWPYGAPAAYEAFATIATPLFAGFSATLVGLVVTSEADLRWPSVSLALLTGSTVTFLMAVQFGIWARSYTTTPEEISEWRPEYDPDPLLLRTIQRLHRLGYLRWAKRFHNTYRIGLLLLLLGLAATLVPSHGIHAFRGLAIGIAIAGCIAEVVWIAANEILRNSTDWEVVTNGTVVAPRDGDSANGSALERMARMLVPKETLEKPHIAEPVQPDQEDELVADLQQQARALESQARALESQARALESQARALESRAGMVGGSQLGPAS